MCISQSKKQYLLMQTNLKDTQSIQFIFQKSYIEQIVESGSEGEVYTFEIGRLLVESKSHYKQKLLFGIYYSQSLSVCHIRFVPWSMILCKTFGTFSTY